ncbi:hemin uptake protein HemP [Thioalkalivibrio sp. XN8]|nr:hemin uptake protein HemP [Thioalkalivibrio sp. XN8]
MDSRELLDENRRLRIRHRGQVYELRETRLGKLILTK